MAVIDRLFVMLRHGELGPAEREQLEHLVCSNARARRRYIRLMALSASLEWNSGRDESTGGPAGDQNQPRTGDVRRAAVVDGVRLTPGQDGNAAPLPPLSGSQPTAYSVSRPKSSAPRRSFPLLGVDWGLGWAGAVIGLLLFSVGLWYGAKHGSSSPNTTAAERIAATDADADAAGDFDASEFVARITGISDDLAWADRGTDVDFLLRLRPHQCVQISSGLLQLDFFSGATVILQGPAEFTPTGRNTSRLVAGRLTTNGINGKFKLSTPVAEVLNLGASFGVSVDADEGTDIVVFKGNVRATSYLMDSESTEVLNLAEASAVHMRADGTRDLESTPHESDFVCSIDSAGPPVDPNELSIVDIVCGGNGRDFRLSGAINPETGLPDVFSEWPTDWRSITKTTDGFPKTNWNPLIDGVFMPDQTGKFVEADSLHRLITLPETSGIYFGPIWARRWDAQIPESMKNVTARHWGRWPKELVNARLEESRVGIVSMHPNVGITLNLEAVREQHRRPASSFRTTLANFGNVHKTKPKWVRKVEFHVFVDGKLKYHIADFTGLDGEEDVVVPIAPEDKRLTLVSTDGYDAIALDYLLLIDPVLKLTPDRRER